MDEGVVFAAGVGAWRRSLGSVHEVVRQELVTRQLHAHLGDAPLRVLDAGCGQGTQAIRLARRGHHVLGVDVSEELLEAAATSAAAEPPEVAARLELRRGDMLDPDPGFGGGFDLVCCHGVAMYLPALDAVVAALVAAARPGGLVSILTRNRASLAMRAGMSADWPAALAAFDARRYTNRLGLKEVRADEPAEVRAAFAAPAPRPWPGTGCGCSSTTGRDSRRPRTSPRCSTPGAGRPPRPLSRRRRAHPHPGADRREG